MDAHSTPDLSWPGPLSRRGFLQVAGVTATAVATARFARLGRPLFRGHPHPERRGFIATAGTAASAAPSSAVTLTLTAAPAVRRRSSRPATGSSPRCNTCAGRFRAPAVSPGGRLAHLPTTAAPSASRTLMSSVAEWLEASRRLRSEGCCDPGSAL